MAQIEQGGGDDKKKKGAQKKMHIHVDFTPMVDMNMLLITFFMLCTTMLKSQTLNIILPTNEKVDKENQNKAKQSEAFTIIVDSERADAVDGVPGKILGNYVYYYEGVAGGPEGIGADNVIKENNLKEPETGNGTVNAGVVDQIRDVLRQKNKEVVSKLDELDTEKHNFEGEIEGTWPESILPTSLNLTLKEGAQVVFIRNDKERRWYNGTVARIAGISNGEITVELEDGNHYVLDRDQWENVQYEYDDKTKRIKETVLGTFTQYPIKLAWAMTIHKSQGLTFNNVVIDMEGGAFSCGQTYVALSRCRSLEGLTLKAPITFRDIFVNPAVIEFSKQFNDMKLISDAKKEYRVRTLLGAANKAFGVRDFKTCVDSFAEAVDTNGGFGDETVRRFVRYKLGVYSRLVRQIDEKQAEIDRQKSLLRSLALEYVVLGKESASMFDDADRDIAINSAMANFDKALNICPDCIDAKLEKAKLLVVLEKDVEAEVLYKEVLKADKRNGEASYGIGSICFKRRKLAEALKHARVAVKAMPVEPSVHTLLADIYEKIGIEDKAEQHRELARKYSSGRRRKSN